MKFRDERIGFRCQWRGPKLTLLNRFRLPDYVKSGQGFNIEKVIFLKAGGDFSSLQPIIAEDFESFELDELSQLAY